MYIYFGLGTNLGDRIANLKAAIEKLKTLGELESVSSIYETEPWGGIEQPKFLNMCVKMKIEKSLTPLEILRTIKNFEIELGREKSIRWGARKIDIDILLIGDEIFHSEELDVPHIRIPERLFVLVPLKEILPDDWRHPENKKTIDEMISELKNESWPEKVLL